MKLLVRIGEQSGTRREGVGERVIEARYLLDARAGAASDHFWPTMPRYWDWHDDLGFDFELEDDVEHRIRSLVREEDLESDLPQDWEITDLTL